MYTSVELSRYDHPALELGRGPALSFLVNSGLCLPKAPSIGLIILVVLGDRRLFAVLPLRLLPIPPALPASASRSRNSDQSSARLSLPVPAGLSAMKSVESEGVLGVRRKGETGSLRLPLAKDPCRSRPAFSFSSSVHPNSAAMSCRTWNFFASLRSSARNWRK